MRGWSRLKKEDRKVKEMKREKSGRKKRRTEVW